MAQTALRHESSLFALKLSIASFILYAAFQSFALEPRDYAIDVECQVQLNPAALVFSWPQLNVARQYTIRRRTNSSSDWGDPIAVLPGSSTGFTDTSVSVGDAYEYEVQLELDVLGSEGGWISAYSYLYSGINVGRPDTNGKVLLVVDSSIAPVIQSELATFQEDLVGAGWYPILRQFEREAKVSDVKNVIRGEYSSDPGNLRSVVLIGHVPVPYSGDIAPDFHESHKGAWPADVYYAELSGQWTDNVVTATGGEWPETINLPGDGKFDQSEIPGNVALELGRIDFWSMPAFSPRTEVDLLKDYFRKNHEFRHRSFTASRRGLIHDNFGEVDGDAPAVDAWRHFSPFFGHDKVRVVGPDEFVPTLNNRSYLWAYGCGGGDYTKADGVGSTYDFAASDMKAVFLVLHGSYFGDWNSENNFLRAAMATPHMALASIWSGTPHWFMHHMALGATIGYSARTTQNNRTSYKSYRNFFPGQVHISLMGDPTLEMFPVIPPKSITASVDTGIRLSWEGSADADIVGYKVFHSGNPIGPFQALTSEPITATSFSHSAGAGTHYYMVRAIKLEYSGSGTFLNASQGVFTMATKEGGPVEQTETRLSIKVEQGTVLLNLSGSPNRLFRIDASTNAIQWNSIGQGNTDETGAAQFRDAPVSLPNRFYRVDWP